FSPEMMSSFPSLLMSATAAVSLAPLSIMRERNGMSGDRVGDGASNRAAKMTLITRIQSCSSPREVTESAEFTPKERRERRRTKKMFIFRKQYIYLRSSPLTSFLRCELRYLRLLQGQVTWLKSA